MTEAAFMPLMRTGLDPVAALGEVREREPVSKLEFPFGITAWLITGYDEAKAVLGSSGDFSNDFSNITAMTEGEAGEDQNPGGLGMADPPNHTRLRKMLTPEFTMRRLQRLIPRIEELVGELLDRMEVAGSPVDFVEAFAMPLPSLVICELLDVPYPDRQQFQRLSGARFDIFGGAGTGLEAISESLEFMGELVRAQRTEPGDGLLGMLIREYGDEIDDRELAGLADGLLIGGHETTASMLALGAIALLSDQAHAALMRTADTESVHSAVEELLRYLTVVQVAFPRFAREDVEVAGVTIPKGAMVLVSLSAADRDPRLGGSLDRFDPRRPVTSHFAFGYGIHRCVGAELARIELRIAYPALLRRFPTLRLDLPMDEIGFREYSVVYGVDRLPVAW
jgi:cytochrome P450